MHTPVRLPNPPDGISHNLLCSYDSTLPYGGKEHFFHFLHGYLIPALSHCLETKPSRVAFEDCGPLMTPKLVEACALAALDRVEVMQGDAAPNGDWETCLVPRWDDLLIRFDGRHQSPTEIEAFRAMTTGVRERMLEGAREACRTRGTLERWRSTDTLVLKRSPEHPFYAHGGGARFSGYGSGRRALHNTSQIADYLSGNGCNAIEIDMGTLPLCEQIMAFRHARAVVGARGAEFAHLFWMQPGATALMFATPVDAENNASRSLAEIFGLRFIACPVDSDQFTVSPQTVLKYLIPAARPWRRLLRLISAGAGRVRREA